MEFEKYRKIYAVGHFENKDIFNNPEDEIIIEEKIDGGNFRFYISQKGKVIIGSRTQQLTSKDGEDTNMNKMFVRCSNFVRDKLKDKNLEQYKGLIFYGENCVKHTINYDWDKIPPFLGFDIKTETGYLHYSNRNEIFENLDLPVVPLIDRVYAKEIVEINDNLVPISEYASESSEDKKAEGIVFKNYDKQIFAKYVRDAFKERNAEAFGGNPKYNKTDGNDNSEIVFKYCTNARIDKIVFKLLDEGKELDMPLMKYLPNRVYEDIMEEEWRDIVFSKYTIDFKELKQTITKRCLNVLKQIITNNALN